jgi:hypothetical protein
MGRLIILIAINFSVWIASAQSDTLSSRLRCNKSLTEQEGGRIIVKADSAIITLEKNSRGFKEMKGYRIQIFIGTIEEAKKKRNEYLALGLPYSSYVKQIVPEHAIEIGDFVTKQEAQRALTELKSSFSASMIVSSLIEPPKYKTK